jgi:O-acetyl-ADP-ribose deacetylase (regulator of RNase III)
LSAVSSSSAPSSSASSASASSIPAQTIPAPALIPTTSTLQVSSLIPTSIPPHNLNSNASAFIPSASATTPAPASTPTPAPVLAQLNQDNSDVSEEIIATIDTDTENLIAQFISGNIQDQTTDVIVNAANKNLLYGSGVAGEIRKKFNNNQSKHAETIEIINKQPSKLIPDGMIAITTSHKSDTTNPRYIIHAISPDIRENSDNKVTKDNIKNYMSTLFLTLLSADRILQIKSIALPIIGIGIFGFPSEFAIEIIIYLIKKIGFINITKIKIMVFKDKDKDYIKNIDTISLTNNFITNMINDGYKLTQQQSNLNRFNLYERYYAEFLVKWDSGDYIGEIHNNYMSSNVVV